MKKLPLLLLWIAFSVTAFAQQAFEVVTKKPAPGSVVTIEYMPRNTVLQGVRDFAATAYLLEGGLPRAVEVPLKQTGGVFRGSVKTADSTRAVFFSFAKDELRDNNSDEGYYTPLYDKTGSEVAGANLALAQGFSSFGGIWELKSSAEKAAAFNKKEFANDRAKEKFFAEYAALLSRSKDPADKELLKTELASRLQKTNLKESDMLQVKSLYERNLKDKEKAADVMAQIKSRYPNGRWKHNEAVESFYTAKGIEDKEKIHSELTKQLAKGSAEDKNTLDNMTGQLARLHAAAGKYGEAKKYLEQISSPAVRANALNSLAWTLAGEGINNKPVDADMGLALSVKSLEAVNEAKKVLAGKPPYRTATQYRKDLDNSYNMFADTYATLLYHKGRYNEAYAVEKAAVEGFKRRDVSMNEAFALLTEKVKGPQAAQAELAAFLEEGKYSPAMKEQLKRLYIATGNTEAQWASYMSGLEEAAYNKLKTELAKKMINLPAPQFALKDLDGKEVALSSLRGKIVVLDFWATWCGPCIASFPGMQQTVNKFKDNPDVVFLFIDTWENDSNRVQKVTEFIAKNKYSFRVLYDTPKAAEGSEFVVVQDFGVEGIPTKFVIDRAGAIRFQSVGFGGSADALVNDLTAMIDMAATESGGAFKKAF